MTPHGDIGNILLRAARAAPRLEAEEERGLISLYRDGDQVALGQLIISNVRLAISRAHALKGYGLQTDDLIQEGIIGLLEAASRFDVDREIRFSAYARWWIRATTMEFVLRNWSIVRIVMSGDQKTLFFNLRRLKSQLERDPSIDPASIRAAIAAAVGVEPREVDLMEARLSGDVALNAPARWDEDGEAEVGDSLTAGDTLLDDFAIGAIDDDRREIALRAAMAELNDHERLIIKERWLTDDIAPIGALAEYLEISVSRVKRLEIGAIEKLQLGVARLQMAA